MFLIVPSTDRSIQSGCDDMLLERLNEMGNAEDDRLSEVLSVCVCMCVCM